MKTREVVSTPVQNLVFVPRYTHIMLTFLWSWLGASYAYIIRRLENADRPFDVLLAVRGNLGSCPLLGMLRFLQQEVAPVMHSLFDRVGVDWD